MVPMRASRRTRRRWAYALLALLALPPSAHAANVATAASAQSQSTAAARLAELRVLIDTTLAAPAFEGATVAMHAVDLATGEVLYRRQEALPLNPASNTKLATTAAALAILGPEHRYSTLLYHEKDALKGAVIEGDVYLRGEGDPSLVTEDLYAMVARLHAQGIRKITGGVVIDASRFDRDELPPGFEQKDELAAYRAPSGAVSVNFNTFVLRAHGAGTPGARALAGLDPAVPSLQLVNETETVGGASRRLFAEVTGDGRLTVRLWGKIGVEAAPGVYRYPIADPSLYTGELMVALLKEAGIKVGRTRVKVAVTPPDARVVATHYSAPLSVLIRAINKYSNNFMAEQVLKTLAPNDAPATFATALTQMRTKLEALGIDLKGAVLGNGSGLYDTNRYTAAQMTAILVQMYRDIRVQPDFMASLAMAGVDGTTSDRMEGTPAERWVRAKTGTLDGISALSGYAGAHNRPPIAFSIIFNGLTRGAGSARKAQDRVAELLTRFAAGQALVDPPE